MEIRDVIAKWVKAARTEAELSGAELGAKLALELGTERGHTKANISHWETAKHSPSLQQLMAIAKITGKSLPPMILDGMAAGGAPPVALAGAMPVVIADADNEDFYQVPKVTLRLSAGVTGYQTEPDTRDGGTLGVSKSWADRRGYHPAQLVAVQVRGESMETTLYSGDTVIINVADRTMVDNAVFAFNYEGEAVIKRLSRDAGEWWLLSDNPDQRKYYRRMCRNSECIVIGRVVKRESEQF